jgi:hypothetical protein
VPRKLPLQGREISIGSGTLCSEYSASLLRSLGAGVFSTAEVSALDAARDWAYSGLVPLTGYADSPMQGPGAIPSAASGALDALKLLAGKGYLADLNGARLLSERAAFLQLDRQGQTSANGSCHLIPAADGWIALNLARKDDWDLMPAWLQCSMEICTWTTVTEQVGRQPVSRLLERGRLLGLPIASADEPPASPDAWFSVSRGVPASIGSRPRPLVIDLSSLWAGPLCTHLLQRAGARVIKVESEKRPDAARLGNSDFFNLLNGGKESVALDFSRGEGRRQFLALLSKADIVVESSRPRALEQLGIVADEVIKSTPGLTWVSLTGHGRDQPGGNWVAFGDDAAVAAGVAAATARPPVFCGDALADPLTGIHAALAAFAYWQNGGGVLLDLSLTQVTAYCLSSFSGFERGSIVSSKGAWRLQWREHSFEVSAPAIRPPLAAAHAPGSDTGAVLDEFQIQC